METCVRCSQEVDGRAITLPKFNILGLDEGKLCADCQQELLKISGSGMKAYGEYTNLPQLRCHRCGHSWVARSAKLPKICPNPACNSPYWNKPRTKGVVAGACPKSHETPDYKSEA